MRADRWLAQYSPTELASVPLMRTVRRAKRMIKNILRTMRSRELMIASGLDDQELTDKRGLPLKHVSSIPYTSPKRPMLGRASLPISVHSFLRVA